MKTEYYGLSNGQLAALFQAQSVLSLLSKLSANIVHSAQIQADEIAAVAGLASERMQAVLADLGSPTQPIFCVPAKEGIGHAC